MEKIIEIRAGVGGNDSKHIIYMQAEIYRKAALKYCL